MGKGRRSSPTALKLLNGETKANRINKDEPVPRPVEPDAPDGMSDEVRAVWDATLIELRAMGLAHKADTDALHCFCEAVINHRKASYLLARSPMLVKSRYDTWMKNPALQVQRDSAHVVRVFAHEFGLTPSARSTINAKGLGDANEENPFAAGTG